MKTKINNKLIRSFNPCYDPSEIGISDSESLKVKDWVEKYRNIVKEKADIIWLLCRKEFMTDRNMRLFGVWCAREALKLVENPDQRSIEACNIAEKYANGEATIEKLAAAWAAARDAEKDAAGATAWAATRAATRAATWATTGDVARDAAWDTAWHAAWYAVEDTSRDTARATQTDKLLTYF